MSFDGSASYLIDSVHVSKLWGKYDISTKFDPQINIFIGINGSYKTTFIMLLYNLLSLEFTKLIEINFKSIEVKLKSGRSVKTITFEKTITKDNEKQYIFEIKGIDKISMSEHDLKLYGKRIFEDDDTDEYEEEYRIKRNDSSLKTKYTLLKENLEKLINVDYLNIHRYSSSPIRRRSYYIGNESSSIDFEIKKLSMMFIRYQSETKTSINRKSGDFLKKAFESLLRNNILLKGKISFTSDTIKEYKDILAKMSQDNSFKGIDFKNITEQLEELDKLVTKVIEKQNNLQNSQQKTKMTFPIVMDALDEPEIPKFLNYISLFPKFQGLFDLYKDFEKEKHEIEEPTKKFLDISNSFLKSNLFPEKMLTIADDGSLMLQIYKNNIVPLYKLSSGEKQLIILLLHTLLQRGQKGVYITDEPELSLHMIWQEKIISALHQLNPNIQLVFATHSPDIVSEHETKIIQMEDILK